MGLQSAEVATDLESWDSDAFAQSIPLAREQVEFAARVIEKGESYPNWSSHKPFFELVFYLCKLDYDFKVLLY